MFCAIFERISVSDESTQAEEEILESKCVPPKNIPKKNCGAHLLWGHKHITMCAEIYRASQKACIFFEAGGDALRW